MELTPAELQRTLQYRARVNSDARTQSLHKNFDILVGEILLLENGCGLLQALLPDGRLGQFRKTWSYSGFLRDGRDFGNWGYAVIMRMLFATGLVNYDHLGDKKLGDVVEAVLHLGYNVHREGPVREYACKFDELCLTFEQIETWTRSLGYWETSHAMAKLLY